MQTAGFLLPPGAPLPSRPNAMTSIARLIALFTGSSFTGKTGENNGFCLHGHD
jgi:hypothetical protein